MEINEIMEQLSLFGHDRPLPREALEEAARQREAVTPLLLDRLDWMWENVRERGDEICGEPEYGQGWYAYFLLAQFREKRAYPKFLRLLTLDTKLLDIVFGDTVTQVGDMLYSTYDGDLDSARSIAADCTLESYARNAAVCLIAGLFHDGRLDRDTMTGFIRERLCALGEGKDEATFAALLADAAVNEYLFELTEDFREAYRDKKVDTMLLGDFDGFLDGLFREALPHHFTRYLGSAADELSGWDCFERDTTSTPKISEILSWKVGRNDPCPCGSGKKFKKCCLKIKEEWELQEARDLHGQPDSYPPVTEVNGNPGLADFYSRDAIAVDMPAYRALKLLKGNLFRRPAEERKSRKEAMQLLWQAFEEMRRICTEKGLKTPENFDRDYKVHYYCNEWLGPLAELLSEAESPRLEEVRDFIGADQK